MQILSKLLTLLWVGPQPSGRPIDWLCNLRRKRGMTALTERAQLGTDASDALY